MKNEIKIIEHSLEPTIVRKFLQNNKSGAIVIFEGVVREFNQGNKIKNITYEAFEAMAVKEITKIVNEQKNQLTNSHEIHSICIHHRVGKLDVGETSIIIGVGINVNCTSDDFSMDNFEYRLEPTSILLEIGNSIEREDFIVRFLVFYFKWLKEFRSRNYNKIIDFWKSKWDDSGKEISIISNRKKISGIMIDINNYCYQQS